MERTGIAERLMDWHATRCGEISEIFPIWVVVNMVRRATALDVVIPTLVSFTHRWTKQLVASKLALEYTTSLIFFTLVFGCHDGKYYRCCGRCTNEADGLQLHLVSAQCLTSRSLGFDDTPPLLTCTLPDRLWACGVQHRGAG